MTTGVLADAHRAIQAYTEDYPIIPSAPIPQAPPTADWHELKDPVSPTTLDVLAKKEWQDDLSIDLFWRQDKTGAWVRIDERLTQIKGTGIAVKDRTEERPTRLTRSEQKVREAAIRVDAAHTRVYDGERAPIKTILGYLGHSTMFLASRNRHKAQENLTRITERLRRPFGRTALASQK